MPPPPDALPLLVKHFRFTIINIGFGFRRKNPGNCIGAVYFIPRIHEQNVFTCGQSKAFVHCIVNSFVGLRNEMRKLVLIFLYNLNCSVR